MISFIKNLKYKQIFSNFKITKILGRAYFFCNFLISILFLIIFLACNNWQISINVLTIIIFIKLIYTAYRLLINFYYIIRVKNFKLNLINNSERSQVASGVMRSGKTSSKNFEAVHLAKKQWKKLKRAYWYCVNCKFKDLNEHLQKHKNEIIEAYNYAQQNIDKFIPCLFSFQTIFVNSRQSNPLSKSMLLQKEKLPFMCVIMVDEISTLFPNKPATQANKTFKIIQEQ